MIENSDELFPAAETLSSLPPVTNNGVAILADGGGHATIAADILTDLGVEIPRLSEETQARLREILPAAASVPNPVDVAGGTDADPSVFAECAQIILDDPNVGGMLLVGLFGGYGIRFAESLTFMEEDAAHQMGKMVKKSGKPIVIHSLFASAQPHALDLARHYGIPVYDSLDIACKCVAVLADYGRHLKAVYTQRSFKMQWGAQADPDIEATIQAARDEGRRVLLEPEAKRLLARHQAAEAADRLARDADEAVVAAEAMAGPVVMKIVSPDILHKSEAGGVRLNVSGAEAVREGFAEIVAAARRYAPEADIRGVLVAPMAPRGVEVIVGTRYDDQFGPVIMFGIGGILVEILKDVAFRVLPLDATEARAMIEEIRSTAILNGVRGQAPSDKAALERLLLKISDIIAAYPQIEEMDLNPVIVHPQGLSVVDARIILKA